MHKKLIEVLHELKIIEKGGNFFIREIADDDDIAVHASEKELPELGKIVTKLICYAKDSSGEYDFLRRDYYLDYEVVKASYGPLGENGPYRWTFVVKDADER